MKHRVLVINSNLGPILHRLAKVHPWRTDRRMTTMPRALPLLQYGRIKIDAAASIQICFLKGGN